MSAVIVELLILFYQLFQDTLQMKFDKQEQGKRKNLASYKIRNQDCKAYSKTGILGKEKLCYDATI